MLAQEESAKKEFLNIIVNIPLSFITIEDKATNNLKTCNFPPFAYSKYGGLPMTTSNHR